MNARLGTQWIRISVFNVELGAHNVRLNVLYIYIFILDRKFKWLSKSAL